MARGLIRFGALLVLAVFSLLVITASVIQWKRLGSSEATNLPDYEYVQGVGWLRLHIVPATWPDAQLRCHLEDATLTAPTTSAITAVMKTTMRAHRLAESSVFTDLYASNPKGDFTSGNGLSMSNITLQWAVGEPNNWGNEEDCLVMTGAGELADVSCFSVHPFFCLKRNTTSDNDQCDNTHNESECNCTIEANHCNPIQEAKQCDATAQGYQLEPSTGSCYKFHRQALPWVRATMVCATEHAHLAVINSELESRVLKNIFAQNPANTIEGTLGRKENEEDFAHLGVLDWNGQNNWVTIFGETLAEAGYNKWRAGEPNYIGIEKCGTMGREGRFLNEDCEGTVHPFICESTLK